MAKQSINWVVIPAGFATMSDGTPGVRLSVFASPRLEPNPGAANRRLDHFPDWRAWPTTLVDSLDFQLMIRTGGSETAVPTERFGKKPDAGLWNDVFRDDTPIKGFSYPAYHTRALRSFPVRNVMRHLREVYSAIGQTSGGEHPVVMPPARSSEKPTFLSPLTSLIGQLAPLEGRVGRLDKSERVLYADNRALDFTKPYTSYGGMFQSQAQFDFYQALRFYTRPQRKYPYMQHPELASVPPSPKKPRSTPDDPEFDFHMMLTSLGDYPELMRRMGLVFDLIVPKSKVPSGNGLLRIRVAWKKSATVAGDDLTPYTRYTLDAAQFVPEEDTGPDGELKDGMLVLSDAGEIEIGKDESPDNRYDLVQVDTDGAAMKTVNFAVEITRHSQRRAYTAREQQGMPSLRTSGVGLVRLSRAHRVAQRLQTLHARNLDLVANNPIATPVSMYADDLLRGYRVDIYDRVTGQWYSLCRRIGTFAVPGSSRDPFSVVEEGYVKAGSATSDEAPDADFYLHEMLFQWTGWSLCAPRPGRTIVSQTDGLQQTEHSELVLHAPGSQLEGINLEVNAKVEPGSLPWLRFGRTYRMRARWVDVAGNSRPFDDPDLKSADAGHPSKPITFQRYDPLIAPAIVLRHPIWEGESVEHMVIRSNYDRTAESYNTFAQIADTALRDVLLGRGYRADSQRHVVPPKTSQLMAELHGMFDKAMGDGGDYQLWFNIARKEEGTLLDVSIWNPETAALEPVVGIALVTTAGSPASSLDKNKRHHTPIEITTPTGDTPLVERGEGLAPGQYVIHDTDQIVLPYLPDAIARGAYFRDLPGVTSEGPLGGGGSSVTRLKFDATPTVYLTHVRFDGAWPDAQPFRLRIVERPGTMEGDSCDETFSHDGVPTWDAARRELTVYLAKAQVATVRYGSHFGKDPNDGSDDLQKMGMWSWLGHKPDLEGPIRAGLHWMFTPWRELRLVHAVQQPLCEPTIPKMAATKPTVGSTYALLTGKFMLSAISTGKVELLAVWDEYVDNLAESGPHDQPGSDDRTRRTLAGSAHVFELTIEDFMNNEVSIPVSYPTQGEYPHVSPDEKFRHEFQDTRHRIVRYNLVGTTRFREYFPQEIWSNNANITRTGEALEVSVPNSARPAAPKVLYVVPTFGWDRQPPGPDQIVSRRCGGGLRIYLDRPWYSSGEGELLGVVIYRTPSIGDTKGFIAALPSAGVPEASPLRAFVTQWGMDPIWSGFPTYAAPSTGNFTGASRAHVGTDLSIEEVPGVSVNVVGYKPEYDEERRLWYCDIEVDAGPAYYPFIRLALARYQPASRDGAHLSRIVLADFAQVAPERVAAVVFQSNRTKFRVAVSGTLGVNTKAVDATDLYKSIGQSRRFYASIQRAEGPIDEPTSWTPFDDNVYELKPQWSKEYKEKMVWVSEQIDVPGSSGPSGPDTITSGEKSGPYRVVVREYEYLRQDANPSAMTIANAPGGRLVYVDTIVLQPGGGSDAPKDGSGPE